MDRIRLATEDEVASIRDEADITPMSSVFAYENGPKRPDFAVFRAVSELDPVFFGPDTSDRRKMIFAWGIENGLRMLGTTHAYYFSLAASDVAWQKVVENWGAERLSITPQIRYKKVL